MNIFGVVTIESCNTKALFEALKKALPDRNWSYEPLSDLSDTELIFSSTSDLSRVNISLEHRNGKEIVVTTTFYMTSYERLKKQKLNDLVLLHKVSAVLASQELPPFEYKDGNTFQGS